MATDVEYEAAVAKGDKLLRMMQASNSEAVKQLDPLQGSAQSKFASVADLSTHGYEKRQSPEVFSTCRLHKALQALGVNKEMACDGGKNVLVDHEHSKTRTLRGIEYVATRAFFAQVCNQEDGVLIALDNRTAIHMGACQDNVVKDYPPLQHWSDIAFLQYISSNSHSAAWPASLRYVFRLTIQNVETNSILNKIIFNHGHGQYEAWPGMTFPIESREGRAILGTPNGSGTAWLLIQHKNQLGEKRISKVTVFYAENDGDLYRWPSLLFWIV